MKNNRYIIGVIGITNGIDDDPHAHEITREARKIGKEITKRGHAVLTGGVQEKTIPASVKGAAMYGASYSGVASRPGRLISILKKKKEGDEGCIEYNEGYTCRHLLVKTRFGNERNLINGYIPDVIIVLGGGSGTLSEIAFAQSYKKPIVFLETNKIETRKGLLLNKTKEDSKKIFRITKNEFPRIDETKLINRVVGLIKTSKFVTGSAAGAVKMALEVIAKRKIKHTYSLPKHPDFTKKGKDDLNADFKSNLTKIMKD